LGERLLRPSMVAVSKKSVKKEGKNEEKNDKKE
jgi:hypothetical protein